VSEDTIKAAVETVGERLTPSALRELKSKKEMKREEMRRG
jgi:hypothetical protein